jgi:hypothetical protein
MDLSEDLIQASAVMYLSMAGKPMRPEFYRLVALS